MNTEAEYMGNKPKSKEMYTLIRRNYFQEGIM